jgi:hypothetical protein
MHSFRHAIETLLNLMLRQRTVRPMDRPAPAEA